MGEQKRVFDIQLELLTTELELTDGRHTSA
jgi:hypothetical protein